jgi:predicted nucleic acid-binding protein
MILVDTSAIADILTNDPDWFEWSSAQIENWGRAGLLCYNAVIFAELAVKFDTQKELENRLAAFTVLPLPLNAAFQGGQSLREISASRRAERAAPAGFFYRRARILGPTSRCSLAIRAGSAASSPPFSLSLHDTESCGAELSTCKFHARPAVLSLWNKPIRSMSY